MDKRETAAFRDNQADAMGSVNDVVECTDEQCTVSARWKEIKKDENGWLVSNDPEIPLLCPECKDRTPEIRYTPSQAREKFNHDLTEWSQ